MLPRLLRRGNFVASLMSLIIFVFILDTSFKAWSQQQKRHEIKEEKTYERPQPSRPIQPEVPGVNRYQDDKVFLEYADSLYKVKSRDTVERQILKGNVIFRQAGLWMYCDSAYYYPEENSLDAFSNVKMEQGDTLFVYADKLFYDGDLHLAKLKNGLTREKVTLINKDVTLTTDSLDYDMQIDKGWYVRWGTLDDKVNTLTSLYGEYSPATKLAEFFHDVVLKNTKDGYTMYTDTLYYSTETHIANIESRTEIQSENDTIITNLATYYTDSGNADLLSRSMIIHRDSTGNVVTLEGDSIIYDNTTRISRAYMFRDPFKRSIPMVITDTAQKTTLIGGFGIYNDSTKEALATIYPLLMEYSQNDTLFLRADTIKTFIVTEMVPDKRRKTKSGFPEWQGFPIVMQDSLGKIWIDTVFFHLAIPFADSPLKMLISVAPLVSKKEQQIYEETLYLNIDTVQNVIEELVEFGEIMENSTDSVRVMEKEINRDGLVTAEGLQDLIEGLQDEFDTIGNNEEDILKPDSIPYEYHVALAYHRGRFFKKDMQGVADSIVFVERDSMLYMFRKPIIWSEERQVTGNRIDVHFNDSTTDWAYLPEYGLMSEWVDEDFYNQIFGKEITAYFKDEGLRRMSISGNVETIFLPQESDSTYNRLVNAESSYMEVYLAENKLDWLKMWPEVSGTVTPIFLVKRNQMYLQKFKWWGFLRPEREWYGDQMRWADNLGEVPDELEQYFMTPSDFGEPKSFTGTRVILPPSSLPIWENVKESVQIDTLNALGTSLDSLINNGIDDRGISESNNNSENIQAEEGEENSETLEEIEYTETQEDIEKEDVEAQSEEIHDAIEKKYPTGENDRQLEISTFEETGNIDYPREDYEKAEDNMNLIERVEDE